MQPGRDLRAGADGRLRCWWAAGSPLLERYHDTEWARGPRDEQGLFERLSLEAFQAGLSWRIVLERRETIRSTLAGLEPARVARLSDVDVDRALADPGIIRNRAKLEAIVSNARVLLRLHAEGTGLRSITEAVLREVPAGSTEPPRRRSDVPAHTPASVELARRLRACGWRFIGPTTAYAYLQAVGWVDDHLAGCHVRRAG